MLTKSDLKLINQTVRKAIKEEAVTKNEAKSFATKDDLKSFATKDDLKSFATKDDLKSFATKDDLKSFATKDDLKPIKQDLAKIRKDMSTITDFFDKEYLDLRNRVERLEEHLGLLPQNQLHISAETKKTLHP